MLVRLNNRCQGKTVASFHLAIVRIQSFDLLTFRLYLVKEMQPTTRSKGWNRDLESGPNKWEFLQAI